MKKILVSVKHLAILATMATGAFMAGASDAHATSYYVVCCDSGYSGPYDSSECNQGSCIDNGPGDSDCGTTVSSPSGSGSCRYGQILDM
jgi:hypothetical protein